MDSKDLVEGQSLSAWVDDLLRNLRALSLAVRAYFLTTRGSRGTRSARAEVQEMYAETSSAARAVLLSVLNSLRPGQSKRLGRVDRRFERFSVACRDLLFAILGFLRR